LEYRKTIKDKTINWFMHLTSVFSDFFISIREDPRIGPLHISLFMAIIQYWHENNYVSPICVFRKELMRIAKISGVATYHRIMNQLHEYGYIKYIELGSCFA